MTDEAIDWTRATIEMVSVCYALGLMACGCYSLYNYWEEKDGFYRKVIAAAPFWPVVLVVLWMLNLLMVLRSMLPGEKEKPSKAQGAYRTKEV